MMATGTITMVQIKELRKFIVFISRQLLNTP